MEETYEEIMAAVEAMKEDKEKWFDKGQKAAGKRLRKNAMIIKKGVTEFRKEISEEIRSM